MKIQKHSEKEHAVFILRGIGWLFVNWRAVLIVWGSLMATIGTLGGFLLNRVVIPAARPVVRPIAKPYIEPAHARIDSVGERVRILERDFKLFHQAD